MMNRSAPGRLWHLPRVVTVHADGSVTKELVYWALGQVTRSVHPAAARIASSQPGGGLRAATVSPTQRSENNEAAPEGCLSAPDRVE